MVQNVKRWPIGDAPTDAQLEEIAALLRAGGIVLFPTDTIYGLHGIERVYKKIAALKGRPEEKHFVMIVASIAQLRSLGVEVPSMLEKIWPAPLTAILERGNDTIAARLPDLKWLRDLLERTGPLISTSANRSGEPPMEEPSDLPEQLLEQIDGLIDGGRQEGKASAIVDFTDTEPRFIRDGDPGFTQILRKTLMKKL